MFRSRSWFGGGGGNSSNVWKPKNPHSLEHLKYLHNVLSKNHIVNDGNRSLLVETLRSIAEILIWGDQNDSTVFDFFLEKNMLSYFLKIMKQKCGSYVCVQLLQTLNILFENIRNETSLYYLLSNNHVNSIIVHKFDFSDEEVMAYYICFLKTLSLKLNPHTIHFFYNEHTNDFPLYTEAIKFFNNNESMVRIAVRTLTLNVYRIDDKSMLKFIRDKTAAPYFSNLVWFIGNHVQELDLSIRENFLSEQDGRVRLADLVAEHLDHLHYLNDILCLEISDLNQVLTEHLLYRLLIPLYIKSLENNQNIAPSSSEIQERTQVKCPKVSSILSLYLLSQIFLIMTHSTLVNILANLLINGNEKLFSFNAEMSPSNKLRLSTSDASVPDSITMDENQMKCSPSNPSIHSTTTNNGITEIHKTDLDDELDKSSTSSTESSTMEKLEQLQQLYYQKNPNTRDLTDRSILKAIFEAMDVKENDYAALFALCLLHALIDNPGIDQTVLDEFFYGETISEDQSEEFNSRGSYNRLIMDKLVSIITQSVKYDSKVRVITLQLLSSLLLRLVMKDDECNDASSLESQKSGKKISCLKDGDLAIIEGAREENILLLQNYFKMDEMFLEVFEDEFLAMNGIGSGNFEGITGRKSLSVEHLMMDSTLLLPPASSPLTGIAFDKRLPCGEVERSRRSIRIYFILRKLSLTLRNEPELYLPLTNPKMCLNIDDTLDLTNSDMLSCTVVTPHDNSRIRRFLVVDVFQLLLVDPSHKQTGWGIVKFVGFLQDMEVIGDKEDSRCLHVSIRSSPNSQRGIQSRVPLLISKFIFDDHIRCMAAKQRLIKGRQKARQNKIHMIAKLLDLTSNMSSSPPQLNSTRRLNRRVLSRSDRPMYTPLSKALPGLAKAVPSVTSVYSTTHLPMKISRDAIPSVNSSRSFSVPSDEEIPLGKMQKERQRSNSSASSSKINSVRNITSSPVVFPSSSPMSPNSSSSSPTEGTKDEIPHSETSFTTMSSGLNTPNSAIIKSTPNPIKTESKKKGAVETV